MQVGVPKSFKFQCPSDKQEDNYQKVQKPFQPEEKKIPDLPMMGKNREDPMTAPKIWPSHSNDVGYGMGKN